MIGGSRLSDVPLQLSPSVRVYYLGRRDVTVGVLSNMAQERLEKLGMRKLNVPLGVVDEEEPHTIIFVSADFETNTEKVAVLVPSPSLRSSVM